jgi:peptide/nickel transport system substrate-binding protein
MRSRPSEQEEEQMTDKVSPEELKWAYEFDPEDPLFGLSRSDLGGPRLSRRTVLRLMAAAGMLPAASLIAACGPTPMPQAEVPTAAQPAPTAVQPTAPPAPTARAADGELVCGWAGTQEISTLDPAKMNQVLQFQITSNVLNGLTHINPDLVAEGDLAETWEVSADGLEWTFKLRQGVTFHNGDPFTADDVVYTFNRSKDSEISIHSAVIANVNDCQKVDNHTVKLVLEKPQASLLVKSLERASGRAMTIVSQGALEQMGPEQYGLTPVGTGSFKVVEHQLGQGVVIERFDGYYDPTRPILDKVTFLPIPEPEPLAGAIEADDIQLIGGNAPAAELINRFLANPDLVVSEVPEPGFQTLWMNPWRDPFKVPDFDLPIEELKKQPGFMVRLAIAKAIDRDDYIKRALFGRAVPGFGNVNPAMGYFFDTAINETSEQRFDPAEAQRLLAEAGFPNGEGFPILKLLIQPAAKRDNEILADILKKNLNIDVELDIKDWTIVVELFDKMDFDLCRMGSGGDYDPDDALVDWMQTDSKFNGPDRPKDQMPFGGVLHQGGRRADQ